MALMANDLRIHAIIGRFGEGVFDIDLIAQSGKVIFEWLRCFGGCYYKVAAKGIGTENGFCSRFWRFISCTDPIDFQMR